MDTDTDLLREFIEKSLAEMPIQKLEKVGDFSRNRSFGKIDRAILNSEPALKKIHKQFSKTPYDFHFYMLNNKEANRRGTSDNRIPSLKEVGIVTPEFVKQHLNIDVPETDDAITVLFNGNGGAEKVMFTGWTMAHRIGHALNRSTRDSSGMAWKEFRDHFDNQIVTIINDAYDKNLAQDRGGYVRDTGQKDKIMQMFLTAIGTFKSARDNKLRNRFEFHYELLAQFLITGTIKFNPLPRSFVTKMHFAWGNPAHEKAWSNKDESEWSELQYHLEVLENDVQMMLNDVLGACSGKIFLM